jgi:hypothetical protein
MLLKSKNSSKSFLTKIVKITIFSLLLFFLIGSSLVVAWENCPFGEINEPFPGTCGRYTDTDNDGICDLSQPSPEDRINTNKEYNETQQDINSTSSTNNKSNSSRINYYFLPILIVLCIFYFITYTFSKKKKIKVSQHRKIWNVILLITFLVSGIFGIILAILISYGIRLDFYSDLLFWHVEFGIAMAIISIFHISWHWKYFKRIIKKNN